LYGLAYLFATRVRMLADRELSAEPDIVPTEAIAPATAG
jgi:hypothetical protein